MANIFVFVSFVVKTHHEVWLVWLPCFIETAKNIAAEDAHTGVMAGIWIF